MSTPSFDLKPKFNQPRFNALADYKLALLDAIARHDERFADHLLQDFKVNDDGAVLVHKCREFSNNSSFAFRDEFPTLGVAVPTSIIGKTT